MDAQISRRRLPTAVIARENVGRSRQRQRVGAIMVYQRTQRASRQATRFGYGTRCQDRCRPGCVVTMNLLPRFALKALDHPRFPHVFCHASCCCRRIADPLRQDFLKGELVLTDNAVGHRMQGLLAVRALPDHGPPIMCRAVDHVGFGISGRNGGQASAILPIPLHQMAKLSSHTDALGLQRATNDNRGPDRLPTGRREGVEADPADVPPPSREAAPFRQEHVSHRPALAGGSYQIALRKTAFRKDSRGSFDCCAILIRCVLTGADVDNGPYGRRGTCQPSGCGSSKAASSSFPPPMDAK